jgi:hypothetical protein
LQAPDSVTLIELMAFVACFYAAMLLQRTISHGRLRVALVVAGAGFVLVCSLAAFLRKRKVLPDSPGFHAVFGTIIGLISGFLMVALARR